MRPFDPQALPAPAAPTKKPKATAPFRPIQGAPSRTIVDGRIVSLSVTAIAKFNEAEEGCALKWYYKTVKGYEEPERTFLDTGDKVHAQLDHYLTQGQDVLGKIARSGLHLLPRPDPRLKTEWGLNRKPRGKKPDGYPVNFFPPAESLLRVAEIPLIGFIDVEDSTGEHVLPDGSRIYEPKVVEALDHKTTSNFKWAKPAEKLIETSQMNGYGKYLADLPEYADFEAVRLSQIYYNTESNLPAIKRTLLVTIASLRERWQKVVEPVAERMKSVAGERDERKVPGNLDACGSFGGCPHRNYCTVYKTTKPLERLRAQLQVKSSTPNPEAKTMSNPLIEKMRGLTAGLPPATANGAAPNGAIFGTPPAPPPAPPAQLTAKDAVQGRAYKFNGGAVGMFTTAVQLPGRQDICYSFLQVTNGAAGGQPFHVLATEPIVEDSTYRPPAPIAQPPAPPAPPLAPPPPPPAPDPTAAGAPPWNGAAAGAPPISAVATTPQGHPRRLGIVDVPPPAGPPVPPPPPASTGEAPKRVGRPKGEKTADQVFEAINLAKEIFAAAFPQSPITPENVLPVMQALLR